SGRGGSGRSRPRAARGASVRDRARSRIRRVFPGSRLRRVADPGGRPHGPGAFPAGARRGRGASTQGIRAARLKAEFSAAAFLLGAFLYLFAAAKLPLQLTNEAMYAVPPVRMLQTGDFLVPRYENRDFLEKPPLTWWVIAASYRLLGVSPFAERLPSVLAAFAAIALTGLWVRRRSGTEAGVLAALVLTFTLQFSVYARTF